MYCEYLTCRHFDMAHMCVIHGIARDKYLIKRMDILSESTDIMSTFHKIKTDTRIWYLQPVTRSVTNLRYS